MKFGICNEMYVGRSVSDVIAHAAGLGYDGIELAPFTLSEDIASLSVEAQREVAQCAADHGIEILGLHWLLAKPEGLHVTTADSAVRRRTQDFFRKLIEIAVNTGGRILTLGSPYQRNFGEGETQQVAAERTISFFAELAPELEAAGVIVALEPLEPEFTNFMTRTAEACDIARAIGSKSVGVTLDTHFMRWEGWEHGVSYADAFSLAGPNLVHLHIQDDNYLAPGTGAAAFVDYTAAVNALDWGGYISFETLGVSEEGQGEKLASDAMAFLNKTFERP